MQKYKIIFRKYKAKCRKIEECKEIKFFFLNNSYLLKDTKPESRKYIQMICIGKTINSRLDKKIDKIFQIFGAENVFKIYE